MIAGKNQAIQTKPIILKKKEKNTNVSTNKLILFTNPSARAGYDTRSVSKQSLTGLNSEFSFS